MSRIDGIWRRARTLSRRAGTEDGAWPVAVMEARAASEAAAAGGGACARLEAVCTGALAIVLAEGAADPGFGDAADAGGGAPSAAAMRAIVRHRRVLEHLHAHGDVLALRLAGPRRRQLPRRLLAALIEADRARLESALAAMAGLEQHQVAIGWDPAGALQRFRDAPELAALGGGARPDARAIAEAAEALRTRLGGEMAALIRRAVEAARPLGVAGAETLMAAAVLARRGAPGLDAALAGIDAIWTEGLRITMVGPLPPISFHAAELRLVGADELAAAARLLGLGAPPDDPDRAFRRRARACHPDAAAPGETTADLAALRAARDLLREAAAMRDKLGEAGAPGSGAVPLLRLRAASAQAVRPGPGALESAA